MWVTKELCFLSQLYYHTNEHTGLRIVILKVAALKQQLGQLQADNEEMTQENTRCVYHSRPHALCLLCDWSAGMFGFFMVFFGRANFSCDPPQNVRMLKMINNLPKSTPS